VAKKNTPNAAVTAGMTWEEFANQKNTRERTSRYATFVLAMKPKVVYDATATYPDIKLETLRGAIYLQARKLDRKVTALIRDDNLFIALKEAVK
jgi:hypothetical protein